MTDDELLTIYRSMRTLSEGMEARNAALEKSTAAQDAVVAQLRQLPLLLGRQLNEYIVDGVKQSMDQDFRVPFDHAVKKPIEDLKYAASEARIMMGRVQQATRLDSRRFMALLVTAGFVLGVGASYLFFNRQVSDLNERIDHLNERVLLAMPITGGAAVQPDPAGKKHGKH